MRSRQGRPWVAPTADLAGAGARYAGFTAARRRRAPEGATARAGPLEPPRGQLRSSTSVQLHGYIASWPRFCTQVFTCASSKWGTSLGAAFPFYHASLVCILGSVAWRILLTIQSCTHLHVPGHTHLNPQLARGLRMALRNLRVRYGRWFRVGKGDDSLEKPGPNPERHSSSFSAKLPTHRPIQGFATRRICKKLYLAIGGSTKAM